MMDIRYSIIKNVLSFSHNKINKLLVRTEVNTDQILRSYISL